MERRGSPAFHSTVTSQAIVLISAHSNSAHVKTTTTLNHENHAVCLAGHLWLCSHTPLNWNLGSTVRVQCNSAHVKTTTTLNHENTEMKDWHS